MASSERRSAGDLLARDAVGLRAAIQARRLTATALLEACLERIRARDPELAAFITVTEAPARQAAARIDRAVAERRACGPLAGVPIAVKDNTATAGVRTTFGSKLFENHVPDSDDVVVARMRAAGAVIVGKTNMPEFACGALCDSALRGSTANPWNPLYSSGGSSGGSAAAVADGMVVLAQGTDFGGSVRTPASFCGIVGLRPTPGRIPLVPKPLPWDTLNTHGILARTVDDAALALEVMAGPDARDPVSLRAPTWDAGAARAADAEQLRLAYSADLGFATVHPEVRRVFEAAVERMRAAGYAPAAGAPGTEGASDAFETIRAAQLHHAYRDLRPEQRASCSASFLWNIDQGAGLSAAAYLAAQQQRARVCEAFERFFERHDILLTVSAAVPPFLKTQQDVLEIDGVPTRNIIDYLRITYVVSLVGFPALSLPCGFTQDGLPVGIQLIARPYEEALLLAFARSLEARCGFVARRP